MKEETIQRIIDELGKGLDSFDNFIHNNSNYATSEIGTTLIKITEENQVKNPVLASYTSLAALKIFFKIGDHENGLFAGFLRQEIEFFQADSENAYLKLLANLESLYESAGKINSGKLKFLISVRATDCLYFTSKLQTEEENRKNYLLKAVDAIAVASLSIAHNTSKSWLAVFTSSSLAVLEDLLIFYSDLSFPLEVEETIKSFVSLTEAYLPVGFDLPIDPEKEFWIEGTLAAMSMKFGNPDYGEKRYRKCANLIILAPISEKWASFVSNFCKAFVSSPFTPAYNKNVALHELLTILNRRRNDFRTPTARQWYSGICDTISSNVLSAVLNTKQIHPDFYFALTDFNKARLLFDFLNAGFNEIPSLNKRYQVQELEKEIHQFNKKKPAELTSEERMLLSMLSFTSKSKDFTKEINELEKIYKDEDKGFTSHVIPLELDDIISEIKDDELIIEYYIPYNQTHPAKEILIILIEKKGLRYLQVPLEEFGFSGTAARMSADGEEPVDISPLGEFIIKLRAAIKAGDNEFAKGALQFLYDILLYPIKRNGYDFLKYKTLFIVPSGVLSFVPFSALITENKEHLIQEIAVSIIPSASVWYTLRKAKRTPLQSILGLANPNLRGATLPGSEQELNSIEKLIPGHLVKKMYYREKATKDNFVADCPHCSLLHLATHGEFPDEQANELHAILLSGKNGGCIKLYAKEISKLKMHPTQLVVLSICNGALFRFGSGDEPMGLVPAFLKAGVHNVIATLWPIEDEISKFYMKEFYKHVFSSGPTDALKKTSCQFIEDGAEISHWASFAITGNGLNLKL